MKLLDCTIRDGGYLNDWQFTDEFVVDSYRTVTELGFDYFEIGFKGNPKYAPTKGKWAHCLDSDIDKVHSEYRGCKIAVMVKLGGFDLADFRDRKDSNISLVRLLIPRSYKVNGKNVSGFSPEKVLEASVVARQLIDKGYNVTLNLPCGDLITEDEVEMIVNFFKDVPLQCLYIADTFGSFTVAELHSLTDVLKKQYRGTIGLHTHNNLENAYEKSMIASNLGYTYIDSCLHGMGRALGNLRTETLMLRSGCDYGYVRTMYNFFSKHFPEYVKDFLYMVAGAKKVHPDYIKEICNNHGDKDVISLIEKIDDKHICFYSKDVTKEVVNE